MTAKDPRAHALQTFEQLLEQCDPDESPEMVARLKTKLARHRQAFHPQQSLLLHKLPPGLIVDIGERVLGLITQRGEKAWFRRVLPLLQTCVQLRAQLRLCSPSLSYARYGSTTTKIKCGTKHLRHRQSERKAASRIGALSLWSTMSGAFTGYI